MISIRFFIYIQIQQFTLQWSPLGNVGLGLLTWAFCILGAAKLSLNIVKIIYNILKLNIILAQMQILEMGDVWESQNETAFVFTSKFCGQLP